MSNSFSTLEIGGKSFKYADIATYPNIQKLPFSYRVLLENLVRQKIGNLNPSAEEQISNILNFRDTLFLNSNNPITKIDTSKISLFDKDTIAVKYTTLPSEKENTIGIIFDKEPKQKYSFTAFPDAFNDLFLNKNDTLKYRFITKEFEDYGRITMNVSNVNSKNLIIELLTGTKKNVVVQRNFLTTSESIVFNLLEPKKYTIRIIIDENKNNKWDTGNYLKRQLPEIILYHKEINNADLRANFFLEENFIIE